MSTRATRPHDPTPSAQNHASQGHLVSIIYPVRDGIAMLVTNTQNGCRVDQWMIYERFQVLIDDRLETRYSFVTNDTHLLEAIQKVKKFGLAVYGVDVTLINPPF